MKFYICDPKRNKPCQKTLCFLNKASDLSLCLLTSYPEYAAQDLDGNPLECAELYPGVVIDMSFQTVAVRSLREEAKECPSEQFADQIDDSGKVLDKQAEDESYKRYKHVQYRNLIIKSLLTLFLGLVLAVIFKLLQGPPAL